MTTISKQADDKKPEEAQDEDAKFKALVASLYGSMSWANGSVDDFLRQKYAETEAENSK